MPKVKTRPHYPRPHYGSCLIFLADYPFHPSNQLCLEAAATRCKTAILKLALKHGLQNFTQDSKLFLGLIVGM